MRRLLFLTCAGLFIALILFVPPSSTDAPKDSEFTYARVRYHMTPEGARMHEVAWHHDWPYSDETFPTVLGEITEIKTSPSSNAIVDIDNPDLLKYPFAYLCEPGFITLAPKDIANLRNYLDRGGFLMIDDLRTTPYSNYMRGFEDDITHFRAEMKKVYPDRDFERLKLSDPIFNTFYKIDSLDMVAPYNMGNAQGPVEFWGLRDPKGHLQMIINNNNDISEFWEWLDEGRRSMHDAATSFHFGINDLMYAMTH